MTAGDHSGAKVPRLLARLEAEIAAAAHPLEADCLRAERAIYLARQGRLHESRMELSMLQMRYASQPHAVISAWLGLGEGLLTYFSDLGTGTSDRIRRAYALSGAARAMRLHALSAAWLAQMDWVREDAPTMLRHLAVALQFSGPHDHSVRSRAAMVIGFAYHFGDRFDLAQPWYARTRHHARAEGDDATLSAMLHNIAWLNSTNERWHLLTGRGTRPVARQMLMSAESSSNYDDLLGPTVALGAIVPMMRAQILAMQGQWAEALALYEQHMAEALAQGLLRMKGNLLADMAWCRLQTGDTPRALQDARNAAAAAEHEVDRDDRAAAHSRLAQVFAALGEAGLAERHARQADEDWAAHAAECTVLLRGLDAMLAGLGPDVDLGPPA